MTAPHSRADRLALLCCAGAGFGTLLDSAVVTYTAPSLAAGLDASTAGVQWFLAIYSLTFGMGLVPGGRLGDAFGRRGLFVAGAALFLVGAVVASSSASIEPAVAARALQGFGAGIISAQVLGIIQDRFTGAARVRALGAYTAAGAAAAVVGPLGAGALLSLAPAELAWRGVLVLSVPFVAAVLVLAAVVLPRGASASVSAPFVAAPVAAIGTAPLVGSPAPGRRGRAPRVALDLPAVAAVGVIVALVTVPVIDPGIPLGTTITILGTCLVLAIAVAFWERRYLARGKLPLLVPALIRSRGFVTGNVVAALWFGGMLAHGAVVTLYLLDADGPLGGAALSPVLVALVLVPGAIVRIVASSASSRVYSRFGSRVLPVSLAVQLVAVGGVITATAVLGRQADAPVLIAVLVAFEVVLGIASGLFEPPMRAVTLGFAAATVHGVAASFLQLTQRLSATFCIALVTGVLFAGAAGSAGGLTPESVRWGLAISAVLVVGALAASVLPVMHGRGAGSAPTTAASIRTDTLEPTHTETP